MLQTFRCHGDRTQIEIYEMELKKIGKRADVSDILLILYNGLYQHNFLPQFLSYVSNIFAAYLGVFVPVVFNRLPSLCHMSQTDISRG